MTLGDNFSISLTRAECQLVLQGLDLAVRNNGLNGGAFLETAHRIGAQMKSDDELRGKDPEVPAKKK
jgi:hypothetical protein